MTSTDITEIYLSPSSDPGWGANDLSSTLLPGDYAFWTVSPGSWDIRAIDELGDKYTTFNNTIHLDETTEFYIDGWKKSSGKSTSKKSKDFHPDSITEDKIELKDKPYNR